MSATLWIGIDTGGTFTDVVMVDVAAGTYRYHKLPSTNDDPAVAILDGIERIVADAERATRDVTELVHGTTVATNAVLERRLARTALVTTRGFRDLIELARQRRPHTYDLSVPKPVPPAPRALRLELDERLAFDGEVVRPLRDDDVDAVVRDLVDRAPEAIAVCLINAYANPVHELAFVDRLEQAWPDAVVCASSDVLPEFREYERTSTTLLNASLMPVMDRYLARFERGVDAAGIAARPTVMQSNGGAVSTSEVRRKPINTFFSGPAGGIVGAAAYARNEGIADYITFDMGGTSTDVCLVTDAQPAWRSEVDLAGFPVRTTSLDIHSTGAGGGSIAWLDPGGMLKVGPRSAGAYPGPAAYGRGGEAPTVTDANVVLGRLGPSGLLDGAMALHADRAARSIEPLSATLGIAAHDVAAGILRIVDANMMGAIRVISIDRGVDPREAAIVAFGGAGPLHAAAVATLIGIERVLVPPRPGLLSALGLLHADARGDFTTSCLVAADHASLAALAEARRGLMERAHAWLESNAAGDATYVQTAEARYVGQSYHLPIEVDPSTWDDAALAQLVARFHEAHTTMYGYALSDHGIEIVNLRLAVHVARAKPTLDLAGSDRVVSEPRPHATRSVWFEETGFVDTPVYTRDHLPVGWARPGPLVIEQMDTTTVVPPRCTVEVRASRSLLLDVERAAVDGSRPPEAPR